MEVLSPTKNLETAKVAIQNGADALYFASPSFGARVNASLEMGEIREIIQYAHKYEVKCFITFNTVVFDFELEKFFDEVRQVYELGADGVILQDFAFIDLINKYFPDMEIHASTQMHVHNTDGVRLIQSLGANRVVVPREMSFARIRKIKDETGIDIESFIHGALCVSYSGQCYDSTLLDQKSANRGRCSQYCRMPQHIYNKRTDKIISSGRYPLNLKDLNNLDNVDKYFEAGVNSLKIEGRLKQYDYVGLTTKAYKQRVNKFESILGQEEEIIEASDLENVYNREFTTGRIDSKNGAEIVNLYKPNNTGKIIGHVASVRQNHNRGLGYYKYLVTIQTIPNSGFDKKQPDIQLQDNLRFLTDDYEDGQVVEKFQDSDSNKTVIYSNLTPPVGAKVYRTQNAQVIQEQKRMTEKFSRRHPIPLRVKVEDGRFHYKIESPKSNPKDEWISSQVKLEQPKKQPTTKETILSKLCKTNDTPFDFNILEFSYEENLFTSFSQINQLKTEIIEKIEKSLEIKRTFRQDFSDLFSQDLGQVSVLRDSYKKERSTSELLENKKIQFFVEIRTLAQYEVVKQNSEIHVLIGNHKLININSDGNGIVPDKTDYLVTPRIIYNDEFSEIDEIVSQYEKICVSELGALRRYRNKHLISNFTFNTTNHLSQKTLLDMGIKKTLLSIELNHENLQLFGNPGSMVNVYGRVPVMIMDYCPINLNKQDDCGPCRRCHKGDYVLRDELEREFPLLYEGNARIGMYSKEPINLTDKVGELYSYGIENFHIRLTSESESETQAILDQILKNKILSNDYYRGNYYKTTL